MYANLKVTTADGDEFMAWKVSAGRAPGTLLVHLDDDGPDEKYANPAGLRSVPVAGTEIVADF